MRLIKYGGPPIASNLRLTPADGPPWTERVIAGFDIETTGIDIESDRIVSAAIVLDIPGREPEVCKWLINPGIDIPLSATAIHGISTEEATLKGTVPALALRGITDTLLTLRRDYGLIPIVVFNSVYDWTILDRELGRHSDTSLVIPLPVIDPLVSDRTLDTYRPGRRTLSAIAAHYGVTIKGAHTAAGDVNTSIKLARALGERYPEFGGADAKSLLEFQRLGSQDWAEHFQEYRRKDDPDFTCPGTWPYHPRTAPGLAAPGRPQDGPETG